MNEQTSPTTIVIVTNNSERFIGHCLKSIKKQTVQPLQIILSDTGSRDLSYIDQYRDIPNLKVIVAGQDVGFCKGNNAAIPEISEQAKYVLLLNPDAFLFTDFIEKATQYMEKTPLCGICTGTLFGYDIDKDQATGRYDSTGIYHTWYGKWYDRDQRSAIIPNQYKQVEKIPAACGALMLCRREALTQTMVGKSNILDPTFYMYKEDIELSLRVKKAGWQVNFNPSLEAYHCRGWSTNRKAVPKKYRLASARNELKIHWRYKYPIGLMYSTMKYLSVKMLNL
jgi:GT2 family glycosyltransferase